MSGNRRLRGKLERVSGTALPKGNDDSVLDNQMSDIRKKPEEVLLG
jgi:hypothetical protein